MHPDRAAIHHKPRRCRRPASAAALRAAAFRPAAAARRHAAVAVRAQAAAVTTAQGVEQTTTRGLPAVTLKHESGATVEVGCARRQAAPRYFPAEMIN